MRWMGWRAVFVLMVLMAVGMLMAMAEDLPGDDESLAMQVEPFVVEMATVSYYDTADGTLVDQALMEVGQTVPLSGMYAPGEPIDGYGVFLGWQAFDDALGLWVPYAFDAPLVGDLTLCGHWAEGEGVEREDELTDDDDNEVPPPMPDIPEPTPTPQPTRATHRVAFVAENEAEIIVEVLSGEGLQPPAIQPEHAGYSFVHWYLDTASPETAYSFGTPVVSDMVLRPYFEPIAEPEDTGIPESPDESAPSETSVPEPTGALIENDLGLDIQLISDNPPTAAAQAWTVSVHLENERALLPGDTVALIGVLDGRTAEEMLLQWQYSAGDAWLDILGATDSRYVFVLDDTNAAYAYRLRAEEIPQ